MNEVLFKHAEETLARKWFRKDIIHTLPQLAILIQGGDPRKTVLPCWKYRSMSLLRMFDVMAMIGVLSNRRIKLQAETPSRLGMMMSIKKRSYLDPPSILLTASRPSN